MGDIADMHVEAFEAGLDPADMDGADWADFYDAKDNEPMALNTHGVELSFGKHKGKLLTRVPVGYLRFMVNEGTPQADLAKAEMERRGDTMPTIELSGHALDNASLRVRKIWHETKVNNDEGLYTWLMRVTNEAIERGEKDGDKILYLGMKFVVVQGEEFPTLKTIMRDKRKSTS